jgi:hypothetical protein
METAYTLLQRIWCTIQNRTNIKFQVFEGIMIILRFFIAANINAATIYIRSESYASELDLAMNVISMHYAFAISCDP